MIGYYMTKSQVKSILSTFEVHFWAYITFLGRFQTLCTVSHLQKVFSKFFLVKFLKYFGKLAIWVFFCEYHSFKIIQIWNFER